MQENFLKFKSVHLVLFILFSGSFSVAETADETPVTHEELANKNDSISLRDWRAPDFGTQRKALGYSEHAFATPKGLEKRVEFWKNIYTKYTTYQGVIHNAEEIDDVYKVVDFSDIIKNDSLNLNQKEKAKRNLIEHLKKQIIAENPRLRLSDLRFQLGQKDRMESAITISGRYIEDFENIFKQNNLPIELVRIVFVESSFNVLARSKVGASGLWQIMPSNARPYKMMSKYVDKRNHPIEATKLAARILKSNFEMLQDWSLAVTGYNHGPTGVLKMTKKYKTRNLFELVENVSSRKSFGFASRNFYASFLAALEVEKNANKYFKNIKWANKLPGENIKLAHNLPFKNLSKWFDHNYFNLQIYNPHLSKLIIFNQQPIPANTWVLIPERNYLMALSDLARQNLSKNKNGTLVSSDNSTSENVRKVATVDNLKEKSSDPKKILTHTVSSGETLKRIAKTYRVSLRSLLRKNRLSMNSPIREGQEIHIPSRYRTN